MKVHSCNQNGEISTKGMDMPTREQIQTEIEFIKSTGQDSVRRKYLKKLTQITKRDALVYSSSWSVIRPFPVPTTAVSLMPDDIQGFMAAAHGLKGDELDLILHSPGGSLEAADQIVQYLRSKYKHIRAIVPQSAMSAATMIACACDEIVMGKHSAIGPIDPQMNINGASIPAHSILEDFNKAKVDIAANPQLGNFWVPRLSHIPPGYLNFCEESIELAQQKVELWLNQYMFKNQNQNLAHDIAMWLGDFKEHKTHGRPIGYELAVSKGLIVKELESDQSLQEAVLSVFHALMATFQTTNCLKIIENHLGKGQYIVAGASGIARPPQTAT